MAGCVAWMAQASAQSPRLDFEVGAAPPPGVTLDGGRAESESIPGLFANGDRHYEISADGAALRFDPPVRELRFFYAHGFGIAPGEARAFDADGALLGRATSRAADVQAAPAGFVAFDGSVARVELQGGAIDAVTWKAAGDFTHGTTINGTWLIVNGERTLPGQGFTLEFLPENSQLLATWFTWDASTPARPRWLVATGGADGALTLYAPNGGRFNADAPVQQAPIGTLRLTFTACDRAEAVIAIPSENVATTLTLRPARARPDC